MSWVDFINFAIEHINSLSFLAPLVGMGYPALRRLKTDHDSDREESRRDEYLEQLSNRLQEMQERGDRAIEEKARLLAERSIFATENRELREREALLSEALLEKDRELTALREKAVPTQRRGSAR